LFNNTNNFYIYGINSNWNTTRQAGTRIYSNGTEIGGNYWTNPNGNGYSDTCEDSDKDGFCDQPYDLLGDGSNVDYLPLSDEYVPQEYYISDCSVLDQEGATYYLTQDIIDSTSSTCIDIQANNITLDCQGHTIDGIDALETYGIYVYRSEETTTNITIKNCVVTDWEYGIYLYNSSSNNFSNIIANSNSYYGIALDSSSNSNNFSNITTNSNSEYGIYINWGNYNTLSNIISNSNNGGIYIFGTYNTLSNITTNSNSWVGIYIYWGIYNTLSNITSYLNLYGIYLYSSSNNIIYNNLFNNTNNFYFDGYIFSNYWNTSYQEGENIWNASLGYIGGNAWFNPDGTGYSDTCHDTNADGFCDDPYVLAQDNIDYLPIAKTVGQYPTYIPPPRLYQLSPIAGILAYVLLPIVFAMIAQKYLLGEVELTLQGLIKYLLIFVMIIIVAIGFAYVFSVL
jgi:parallel beta-helix repeat protein